jgi:hypothetical protein
MTGRDRSLNSAPPPVGPKGPFPLRERWGDRKRNLQEHHTAQGLFENCQAGRASVLASPNIYMLLWKSRLARTLALRGRVFEQAHRPRDPEEGCPDKTQRKKGHWERLASPCQISANFLKIRSFGPFNRYRREKADSETRESRYAAN